MRVTLNGYVVGDADQWLYDYFEIPAFSPQRVRQAIKDNPEGEALTLELNSGGGSVFAGFEMYSLLRGAKCDTVAEVQSLAASAASTIMSGCGTVRVSPVAQVMMHLPSIYTAGNQNDHKESVRMLESITQSILNGYELKCGGKCSREKLRGMMDRTSWLSAQETVDIGLADEILFEGDPAGVMNAAGGMPAAADLLARYEKAVKGGATPAPGHPVTDDGAKSRPAGEEPADVNDGSWRDEAAIAIERERFCF